MFGSHKKFSSKNIGAIHNYTSYGEAIKPKRKRGAGEVTLVIICIFLVLMMGKYLIAFAQSAAGAITRGTVGMLSNTLGDEVKKDTLGNTNIMIVGYGGANHAGGNLADSIMVASINPKLGAVTMLSVPRDLYVHDDARGIIGRINEVMAVGVGSKKAYATGALYLKEMLQNIMGVDIQYYALVDFGGFKNIIDTLGGITIDIPEGFTDTTYPTPDNGYMTIHFDSGVTLLDGEKALQYARSRHTTSDFARSLRQQQIIKGILDTVSAQGVSNITKIKKLYNNYTEMVKTDLTLKEIMGMAKYAYKIKHIFSYGYTTECSTSHYQYSRPGCFLYTPERALFNGASVMIPIGASPTALSSYEYTKLFAQYVLHNQDYLVEGNKIAILNGIDKTYAKQVYRRSEGFANQLAVKLVKYAFTISDVQNLGQTMSGTTLYVISTGDTKQTIKTLQNFVTIDQTITENAINFPQASGADLILVLGNNYVDRLQGQSFNYYK